MHLSRSCLALALACAGVALAQPDAGRSVDPAVLTRIREAALASPAAYQLLAQLTDEVGPRLSGSPGAAAAVAHVAAAMRDAGLEVTLQPVQVTHWVRGEESAELVDYPHRPPGLTQRLHLTALGGSGPTPPKGLTARVVVLHSFDEVAARAAELKGAVALLDLPFDRALADNGESGQAYGAAAAARGRGPLRLAQAGAAAALVRSVGGADFRLPHTGMTVTPSDGGVLIPAAALSSEDVDLVERLAARGPVTLKLVLGAKTLPKAESANVLAELKGREAPDELVVVSGHLDSWDLGTGAIDDGAGVSAALGAVALLRSLGLQPRRTIRAIAWMDEENGSTGSAQYFAQLDGGVGGHVAGIESDSGGGHPLGVVAHVPLEALPKLEPVMAALRPLGAPVLRRSDTPVGADLHRLSQAGVPGFAPLLDTQRYFDYHHTAADTLDKVNPDEFRRQVAVLAVLAWALAELDPLPRVAQPKP